MTSIRYRALAGALLITTMLGAGVAVYAQPGNPVWDATRLKVQQKAEEWRRQGFIGPTMASHAELAYTGIIEALSQLEREFTFSQEESRMREQFK